MLFLSVARLDFPRDQLHLVDGVELRLDLIPNWTLESLKNLLNTLPIPVMFTLPRTEDQEWERTMVSLLQLSPAWIDLPYDCRIGFAHFILEIFPKTKVLVSYHHFHEVPEYIAHIYDQMQQIPADAYKIACFARTTTEALELALFGQNQAKLTVLCMGEKGTFIRALGPVLGNPMGFACLNTQEKTAPGQLSLQEITHVYRYRQISPQTHIYGLIGFPVEQSQGHFYHNAAFSQKERNAIYVKMNVSSEELDSFFMYAKKLGFKGFSVTMPLKESVLSHIDRADAHVLGCKASNTLSVDRDCIVATNTDGVGALDVLERRGGSVQSKRLVIIGSGGTARAIAFEAIQRGALVCIVNRTLEKAKSLAKTLGCSYQELSESLPPYDFLINATPVVPEMPESVFVPGTLVMDVVYVPKETGFLKMARQVGCDIIYGEEMFESQAEAQQRVWKYQ